KSLTAKFCEEGWERILKLQFFKFQNPKMVNRKDAKALSVVFVATKARIIFEKIVGKEPRMGADEADGRGFYIESDRKLLRLFTVARVANFLNCSGERESHGCAILFNHIEST
ncbi:MAG: hypothetical protein ACRC6O_10790, partial [Flavobacterium sp.]